MEAECSGREIEADNESYSVEVDFSSPLNRGVLEYLKGSRPERKAEWESISPLSVKNPILSTTRRSIGVRLWSDLAASLPVECRWIVLGAPALVHPETGILFGRFGTNAPGPVPCNA